MEDLLAEFATEPVRKELLRQLEDSIKEEKAAIDVYRRRADYARRGYPTIALIYDHIREEEEHHIKELKKATEELRLKWSKEPPRFRRIGGKNYKLVGVERSKDTAEAWAANMREHGEKISIIPFENRHAVYREEP